MHLNPTDLGLPSDDLEGSTIVFNPAASAVSLQVWLRRDGCHWGRVFLRVHPSTRYTLVGDPGEECSDSYLVSGGGARLFFLRFVSVKTPVGLGFNTQSIVRVSASTGACEFFPVPELLRSKDISVFSLLGATDDGDAVLAQVGTPRPDRYVEHRVAKVDLLTGSVELIMDMPAVFA